jgi:hypothetical protein
MNNWPVGENSPNLAIHTSGSGFLGLEILLNKAGLGSGYTA